MAEMDALNKIAAQLARIATGLEVNPAPAFVVLIDADSTEETDIPPIAVAVSSIKSIAYGVRGWWVDLSPCYYADDGVGVYRMTILNGEEICSALGVDPLQLIPHVAAASVGGLLRGDGGEAINPPALTITTDFYDSARRPDETFADYVARRGTVTGSDKS